MTRTTQAAYTSATLVSTCGDIQTRTSDPHLHSLVGTDICRCDTNLATLDCQTYGSHRPDDDLPLWMMVELNPDALDRRPQTVAYRLADGTQETYTFAFLAHLDDGRRLAIAVEDEAFATLNNREAFFQAIAPFIPKDFADGIALFTQRRPHHCKEITQPFFADPLPSAMQVAQPRNGEGA